MIEIIVLLLFGIIAGRRLVHYKRLQPWLDRLILWSIFGLLFFLGLSIGRNPDIMHHLPTLGLTAALISLAAITGSLIMAWLLHKLFFKTQKEEHEE